MNELPPAAATPTDPARPAASVIILRDHGADTQVLMLQRQPGLAAFAGLWAFPGGKVESADRAHGAWLRELMDDAARAELLGLDGGLTTLPEPLPAWVAAVRETFEETGLLYARGLDSHWPDRLQRHGNDWRIAVRRDASAFEGLLSSQGAAIDVPALAYWSRWLPPPEARVRFDTDFFLARAPHGQVVHADPGEASAAQWISLDDSALETLPCAPVTRVLLQEIRAASRHQGGVDALLAYARRRPVPQISPRRTVLNDVTFVVFPWDPAYDTLPGTGVPWSPAQRAEYAALPSRLVVPDGLLKP